MPISAQDFRRSAGCYDDKMQGYVADSIIQQRLNRISASQTRKLPQQFGWMTLLALLSVVSNNTLRRHVSERFFSDSEYCRKRGEENNPAASYNVTGNIKNVFPNDVTLCDKFDSHYSSTTIVPPLNPQQLMHGSSSLRQTRKSIEDFLPFSFYSFADAFRRYDPLSFPGTHAAVVESTLAPLSTPSDSVATVKNDYTCIHARQNLSSLDILYRVADTIDYPISTLAIEIKVITSYLQSGVCPTEASLSHISVIAKSIDAMLSSVLGFFSEFNPLGIIRNIITPAIKMVVDDYRGRGITIDDALSLNENILSYARGVVDISTREIDKKSGINTVFVPQGMSFENDYIYVHINKKIWRLTKVDGKLYAARDNVLYRTSYVEDTGVWHIYEQELINAEKNDDLFNQLCESRYRRGVSSGKLCGTFAIADASESGSSHASASQPVTASDSYPFTHIERDIINRLDIGLSPHSFRVDKVIFPDNWVIYRVRDEDKLISTVYHAVEMNGKLVPIKATAIINNHISCEIYDLKDWHASHRVEFYNNQWRFEPVTSFYLSHDLKEAISHYAYHAMFYDTLDLTKISMPGPHGLQVDKNGHTYLRINNKYIKVHQHDIDACLAVKNEGRIYITKTDGKFHLSHARLERGRLEVNALTIKEDINLHSSKGVSSNKNHLLNYHWNLVHVNIKNYNYHTYNSIGSELEVMLRMKYNVNGFSEFFEPPDLQWHEIIKVDDDGQVWRFVADMYQHNRHSPTFLPWNEKYLLAYSYTKKEVKNGYNEPARIYNHDMEPLAPDALPNVLSNDEKIACVKNYLKRNGGFLDITLSDYPKLQNIDAHTNKERLLKITISFLDKTIFSVNQGIVLQEGKPPLVFVTTGHNINVAESPVNASPPESVARKRVKKSHH
ncbi:hypothetical protein J5069_12085 [Candidatus Symbiopectobacterium sp. NZEC127]|uniref:hypothetical protein n=1 Tax=Candidatus Symbiopectobacterium sp. NZEC127 TaxID=2820472 RepID=UPI0022278FE8|nr:hypothetical protein [Candidatus Symbiopectobacterium sp. NZEC127]MCW2486631.1 hypothetical protein [Candidatus Symbiopectobacterium sp. NZEC127]